MLPIHQNTIEVEPRPDLRDARSFHSLSLAGASINEAIIRINGKLVRIKKGTTVTFTRTHTDTGMSEYVEGDDWTGDTLTRPVTNLMLVITSPDTNPRGEAGEVMLDVSTEGMRAQRWLRGSNVLMAPDAEIVDENMSAESFRAYMKALLERKFPTKTVAIEGMTVLSSDPSLDTSSEVKKDTSHEMKSMSILVHRTDGLTIPVEIAVGDQRDIIRGQTGKIRRTSGKVRKITWARRRDGNDKITLAIGQFVSVGNLAEVQEATPSNSGVGPSTGGPSSAAGPSSA